MKILVIDDNYASRKLLKAYLEDRGTCDLAADGAEGIALFESALRAGEGYALVCLDLMMPGLDGHEALRELRKIEEKRKAPVRARIVMTTAVDDRQDVMASFNDGCDGYLVKPINAAQLDGLLERFGLIAPAKEG